VFDDSQRPEKISYLKKSNYFDRDFCLSETSDKILEECSIKKKKKSKAEIKES